MARKTKPSIAPVGEAQATYLRRRDRRIEELFLREGYEPRDIANLMLDEGTLESKSYESAVRTVRGVVADIRKRIDDARDTDGAIATASNELDALERKLRRLRGELRRQETIASGEPDDDGKEAVLIVTMMGSGGEPFQFEKPKWPAGVRQKASKDAALLAEKIADLECVIAEKRAGVTGEQAGATEGGLTIIESDKSIEELISANLHVN